MDINQIITIVVAVVSLLGSLVAIVLAYAALKSEVQLLKQSDALQTARISTLEANMAGVNNKLGEISNAITSIKTLLDQKLQ